MRRFLFLLSFSALLTAVGCGGGSSTSNSSISQTVNPPSAQNTQPIIVDAGPTVSVNANGPYANGVFTTVIVCVPGSTTNCNTIDHVLVDTGSVGLRLVHSSSQGALTVNLPHTAVNSNPIGECTQFVDTSFLWGPVETADVTIGSKKASSIPINVIGDTSFSTVPSSCDTGGFNDSTVASLGANGVLGVGIVQFDCGSSCVTGVPPTGEYYSCPPSVPCQASLLSLAQQVQNPVSLFATDNNGVIIELPAISGPQLSVTGTMIFGIGTESNNGLGSAKVFSTDNFGNFTTTFNGHTLSNSFIDSGSNGYFFDDSSRQHAPSSDTFFYCPSTPTTLSPVNMGTNATSATTTLVVQNAVNEFNTPPGTDTAFPGLSGPNDGTFTSFDWGLPFFYGRNVYTSIAGTTAPGGPTPYWAY